MDTVSLKDAKEHLEELLERAARGEDVRIRDDRLGTVRLLPVEAADQQPKRKRHLGHLKGKIPPPPDDFFDPLSEDELKLWYGDKT